MRYLCFFIFISITELTYSQFSNDKQTSIDSNKIIIFDNKKYSIEDYYKHIDVYITNKNKDTVFILINNGISQGDESLFSFFANSIFYPYDESKYLANIELAHDLISRNCIDFNKSHCKIMREMYLNDQKFRNRMTYLFFETDMIVGDSIWLINFVDLNEKIRRSDSLNIKMLDSLLKINNGKLVFFSNCDVIAKRSPSMVILHSDQQPDFQKMVLRKYKKNIINAYGTHAYAAIYDRYLHNINKQPVYFEYNPNNIEIMNKRKTNKKRKKIGLKSIDYDINN